MCIIVLISTKTWDNFIKDRGERMFKCANCGNDNQESLFDEDDTFYCSKCAHRTRIDNGEDDSVICPCCGELRDRKAAYCRNCMAPNDIYP